MIEQKPPQPESNTESKSEIFVSEENKPLRQTLHKIYVNSDNDAVMEMHEKIVLRAQYLKQKYPNWRKYEVFHIMIGSSVPAAPPGDSPIIVEDLPGEDSVKTFLGKLLSELVKKSS